MRLLFERRKVLNFDKHIHISEVFILEKAIFESQFRKKNYFRIPREVFRAFLAPILNIEPGAHLGRSRLVFVQNSVI